MKKGLYVIILFLLTLSETKAQSGSIDFSFRTDFDLGLFTTAGIQVDGKIIVAGSLPSSFIGGQIKNLIRINPEGTLDLDFKTGTGFNSHPGQIEIKVQPNGAIIAIGRFDSFNRVFRHNIARIGKNGFIDSIFHPKDYNYYLGSCLAIQTDEKIIAAEYDNFNGTQRLVRFNKDGSRDSNFKTGVFNGIINSISIQADGDIIVGGNFTKLDTIKTDHLARLKQDGSLDPKFGIKIGNQSPLYGSVFSIVIQPDGKIIVGGNLVSKDPEVHYFFRLDKNGYLDTSFNVGRGFEVNNGNFLSLNAIYLQKDGKIIVGGRFNRFNGVKSNGILRLNSNGSLDTTFKTGEGFDNAVMRIFPHGDNKILVFGHFNNYDSYLSTRMIRLNIGDKIMPKDDTTLVNSSLFSAVPNPSLGKLILSAFQPLNLITITDALGKLIFKIEPLSDKVKIDITDYPAGLYFLRAFSEHGNQTQKILKL